MYYISPDALDADKNEDEKKKNGAKTENKNGEKKAKEMETIEMRYWLWE